MRFKGHDWAQAAAKTPGAMGSHAPFLFSVLRTYVESRAEDVALPLDTGGLVASLWRWIRLLELERRQLKSPNSYSSASRRSFTTIPRTEQVAEG